MRTRAGSFKTRAEDGQLYIEGYFAVFGSEYKIFEINRTEAITKVAGQFISSANTTLNAIKLQNEAMDATLKLPEVLGG